MIDRIENVKGNRVGKEELAAVSFYRVGSAHAIETWIRGKMEKSPNEKSLLITNCFPEVIKKHFSF
jgi:hypothetical protein